MKVLYFAAASALALFLSIGMPIWAGACVQIAVAAANYGVVRTEFAGDFGQGLFFAPILILIALAVAWGVAMVRQSTR